MQLLRHNFRQWWQPPKNIRDREAERRVTFLELFYDLVYVVLISQLSHTLADDITPSGVVGFVSMFLLVWFAWFNGAIYHDLHGNNDIRTRVFTFLQMFTVAAMTVFAHNALGEGSVGFALSFTAYQLILTFLWWRTGVHDSHHRPLSQPYTFAYLLSTLLFFTSAFVPGPFRFYMWGVALFVSLIIPQLIIFSRGRKNPEVQAQIDLSFATSPSVVERFGLLTIIVLGEVIVGVVSGVAGHHPPTWLVSFIAALGMVIAIGLWWIYFDFISQHMPIDRISKRLGWMSLHVPLTIAIVATGATILNVVQHASEILSPEVRWLLVGAVATALVSIALLMRSIQIPEEYFPFYRRGGIVTFVSGFVILLLGFSRLNAIPLLLMLVLLLLTPVVYGVAVWIKMLDTEEAVLSQVAN